MTGPFLRVSSSKRSIARNLLLDVIAAVGVGVTMALVTSLLPTIARRGGLAPLGLAALAAAPFVANLLGAWAGRLGPRSAVQLALVRSAGAAALTALLLAPSPVVMIAAAVIFWVSLSFGGPYQLRLWGAMYPARRRGQIVGFIGTGRAAAGALAAVAGGLVADRLGGAAAVALAGLVGAICAVAYAGLRAEAAGRQVAFSARDSIRALRERPVLSRVALAQGFYGGGLIAALPLYALVYVDRLNLSIGDVAVIGLLTAVATTASFILWGAVSDRHGALVVLRIGSALGLASLVLYVVAPGVAVLWLAAIAAGSASASIDVGIAAIVSDHTPLSARAAAMAGWNAITGARGVVAAFAMSALLQVGFVDVTTGLLACAAVTAVGVVLYARSSAEVVAPVGEPARGEATRGAATLEAATAR